MWTHDLIIRVITDPLTLHPQNCQFPLDFHPCYAYHVATMSDNIDQCPAHAPVGDSPISLGDSPIAAHDYDALAERVTATNLSSAAAVSIAAKPPRNIKRARKCKSPSYNHLQLARRKRRTKAEVQEGYISEDNLAGKPSIGDLPTPREATAKAGGRDDALRRLWGIVRHPATASAQLDAIKQLAQLEGWGPVNTDAATVSASDAEALRARYLATIRSTLSPSAIRISVITRGIDESATLPDISRAIGWLRHTICSGEAQKQETISGDSQSAQPARDWQHVGNQRDTQ